MDLSIIVEIEIVFSTFVFPFFVIRFDNQKEI